MIGMQGALTQAQLMHNPLSTGKISGKIWSHGKISKKQVYVANQSEHGRT
jgi:hypothetical protein